MDERAALSVVGGLVDAAGDDAAVVGDAVFTIDMLHERTDFPRGTTHYTMGWRSVGASLSDVAAMGARATAAVAVYGAPRFDEAELTDFVAGATDVCRAVDADYVGGDLDDTAEVTAATAAIGETENPVGRGGARPGDVVAVTGSLGRSAAALDAFDAGEDDLANDLFRFTPRVPAGRVLAPVATAMMDSSDGLARSLHQLAERSDVGFAVEQARIPVVDTLAEDGRAYRALTFGEDFELVVTLPEDAVDAARARLDVPLSVVGEVVTAGDGVTLDGAVLPDEGYTHVGVDE